MLTVGDKLPAFDLKYVDSIEHPETDFPRMNDDSLKGRWTCLFFWPKDFTFVCPTEIVGYNDLLDELKDRDCDLIGGSTDTDYVHFAWRRDHDELRQVKFPWLADNNKELTGALGILEKDEGVALRATFLIDPDNIIRHVQVNDLSVGRNPEEALRILDALQTDELCPCNWNQGGETLDPKKEAA